MGSCGGVGVVNLTDEMIFALNPELWGPYFKTLHPGDLPNPGIEPGSPILQVDSLLSKLPGKPKLFSCYSLFNS